MHICTLNITYITLIQFDIIIINYIYKSHPQIVSELKNHNCGSSASQDLGGGMTPPLDLEAGAMLRYVDPPWRFNQQTTRNTYIWVNGNKWDNKDRIIYCDHIGNM